MENIEWASTTLGQAITLQRGFDLPNDQRLPGSIPVISSSGVFGKHSKAMMQGPGVVTGRYGTIGQVFYVEEDYWPLNTTLFVKDFKGNHARFISYLLRTLDFQTVNDKSSVPGVNRNDLHKIQIKLPPLPEQQAIAATLGALDDKIELNRRMNQTLEELGRTLFQVWFVDFAPVRAKREGRTPEGMDAETAALFPAEFQDSPLGPIPKGWGVATIGEMVRVVGGGTPSTKQSEYWDGGTIPWATPKDLAKLTSPVLLETERCITAAGLRRISSGLLPQGTVLLSSRAPIGYLAIAESPVAVNQGFIAMECNDKLPNNYVLRWAQENMATIEGRANGSTFQEISKSNFRPIEVIVPPPAIMTVFNDQAEAFHRQTVNLLRQSESLAALRDALLPKLLSGEIRLAEAEAMIA